MQSETIEVGMQVRYPRTGTTGKVQEIREFDGREFARIEKTDLYYRTDSLIMVAEVAEKKRGKTGKTDLENFKKEQNVSESDLRDSIDDVTGVGAG